MGPRRSSFLLRALLCFALPLALFAPYAAAFSPERDHACACGMEASTCFCPLSVHAKQAACGKGGQMSCALRPSKRTQESAPTVALNLRGHLGIFEVWSPGLGLLPGAPLLPLERYRPSSDFPLPETPPPRGHQLLA